MPTPIDDREVGPLMQAILSCYGYDFRGYNEASFKRLVMGVLNKHHISTISQLQEEIVQKPAFFARILPDLTVTTSEMFRDPAFYRLFQEEVIPFLQTYSAFRMQSLFHIKVQTRFIRDGKGERI